MASLIDIVRNFHCRKFLIGVAHCTAGGMRQGLSGFVKTHVLEIIRMDGGYLQAAAAGLCGRGSILSCRWCC